MVLFSAFRFEMLITNLNLLSIDHVLPVRVLQNSCFRKDADLTKIHRKTPVPESLF